MSNEINQRKINKTMSEHQNIGYKQSWHDDYLKWAIFNLKQPEKQERIRMDFGIISERIQKPKDENIHYLRSIYEDFTEYLNKDLRITSEKLRKSFGITSNKKFANPIYAFQLIVLFPDITAEQIGSILGVSPRSAETYIKILREEKLIERVGGKKEGYWRIIIPKE